MSKKNGKPSTESLRHSPLFQDLEERELDEIAALGELHQLSHGQHRVSSPETGAVYLVTSGKLNVIRHQEGQDTFLFALEAGEFHGETPMENPPPDQFLRMEAMTDVDLISMDWATLMDFLRREPALSTRILERVLIAAGEKFGHISREYSHMVRQKGVDDENITSLFSAGEPDGEDQPRGLDS